VEQTMRSPQRLPGPLPPCSASTRIGAITLEKEAGRETWEGHPHARFEWRGEETEAMALSIRARTRKSES